MQSTGTAIIKVLKNELVYTITFDNGSEFAEHQEVAKALKTKIYFARPYKSCERGLDHQKPLEVFQSMIAQRLHFKF